MTTADLSRAIVRRVIPAMIRRPIADSVYRGIDAMRARFPQRSRRVLHSAPSSMSGRPGSGSVHNIIAVGRRVTQGFTRHWLVANLPLLWPENAASRF